MPPIGVLLPYIIAGSLVATTGLSIASAAGAFDPDAPDVPQLGDEDAQEARARAKAFNAGAFGRDDTLLNPQGVGRPVVGQPTLLGGG